MQCYPGYYSVIYSMKIKGEVVETVFKKCQKQQGNLTRDFFIQPEKKNFFKDKLDKKLWAQYIDANGGLRMDDPLYFL